MENYQSIKLKLVENTQIFNEKYRHLIFVKYLGGMGKKCEGGSVKFEIFGSDKWDNCQKKP